MLENFTRELEVKMFLAAKEIDGHNIKAAIAGNRTERNVIREQLIMQVHQAVYYMVKMRRKKSFGVVRDDYISEGMLGITEAYLTFDVSRDIRWMTYACDVIWKRFWRWDKQNKLIRKFDGGVQELAETSYVQDKLITYDDHSRLDPQFDAESLITCCQSLTENEKEVFLRRVYGEKLRDIGDDKGLSRERIRQIEKKAKEKVSDVLRERWSDYEFH